MNDVEQWVDDLITVHEQRWLQYLKFDQAYQAEEAEALRSNQAVPDIPSCLRDAEEDWCSWATRLARLRMCLMEHGLEQLAEDIDQAMETCMSEFVAAVSSFVMLNNGATERHPYHNFVQL